jgi:hypothetical protein
MIAILLAALAFPSFRSTRERPSSPERSSAARRARGRRQAAGVSAGLVLADGTELALAAGLAIARRRRRSRRTAICARHTGKTFVAATISSSCRPARSRSTTRGRPAREPAVVRAAADAASSRWSCSCATARSRAPRVPAEIHGRRCSPTPTACEARGDRGLRSRPRGEVRRRSDFAYSDTKYILLGMIVELRDEEDRCTRSAAALPHAARIEGRRAAGRAHAAGTRQWYAGGAEPVRVRTRCSRGRTLHPEPRSSSGRTVASSRRAATSPRGRTRSTEALSSKRKRAPRLLDGMDAPRSRGPPYGLGAMLCPARTAPRSVMRVSSPLPDRDALLARARDRRRGPGEHERVRGARPTDP